MISAKRRRIDSAALALAKPFRSPCSAVPEKAKSSPEQEDECNVQRTQLCLTQRTRLASSEAGLARPDIPTASPNRRMHKASSISVPPLSFQIALHDAEFVKLQKQSSALLLKLKDINASLDIASQALKIAKLTNDRELESLSIKWRRVSRDVAEDLFTTAQDQVNNMGGIAAWHKMYTKPYQDQSPWTNDADPDKHQLTDVQKEQLSIAMEDAEAEAEKYGLKSTPPKESDGDGDDDDDSFTIDMMLKHLNVDLQVIGYDVQAQQWID